MNSSSSSSARGINGGTKSSSSSAGSTIELEAKKLINERKTQIYIKKNLKLPDNLIETQDDIAEEILTLQQELGLTNESNKIKNQLIIERNKLRQLKQLREAPTMTLQEDGQDETKLQQSSTQ